MSDEGPLESGFVGQMADQWADDGSHGDDHRDCVVQAYKAGAVLMFNTLRNFAGNPRLAEGTRQMILAKIAKEIQGFGMRPTIWYVGENGALSAKERN